MSAPLIDSLILKRDNSEIIRDEIASILLAETTNQQALATTALEDPGDWKLRIYTERANPWEEYLDLPETSENPIRAFPIVNVWLDNLSYDMRGSDVVKRQKATAVYNIDCYGYGVSAANGAGHNAGDQSAALECQRAVRLVRNILMAATYTYLGMQKLVWQRWPNSVQFFQPQLDQRAVQNINGARLALQVVFNEFSPQVEGEELELISATVKRSETGQIYFTADYDTT